MTIYNGKDGSFNVFWKGLLISSFPLHKKDRDIQRYIYQGEYLILEVLRDPKYKNCKIKEHIQIFISFCNVIYKRKKANFGIRRSDHQLFLSCVMALHKLKIIDFDEHVLIMPKKKQKK